MFINTKYVRLWVMACFLLFSLANANSGYADRECDLEITDVTYKSISAHFSTSWRGSVSCVAIKSRSGALVYSQNFPSNNSVCDLDMKISHLMPNKEYKISCTVIPTNKDFRPIQCETSVTTKKAFEK